MPKSSFRRVSDAFRKDPSRLPCWDVVPGRDSEAFIDPYLLMTVRGGRQHERAKKLVDQFFAEIVRRVRSHKAIDGLFMHAGEADYTYLGYSKGRPAGSGMGSKTTAAFKAAAINMIRHAMLHDEKLIASMADIVTLIPGVGPDRMSDLLSKIIGTVLFDFTEQCVAEYLPSCPRVRGRLIEWCPSELVWRARLVMMPAINGHPTLLVPRSLCTQAPQWNAEQLLSTIIEKCVVYPASRESHLLIAFVNGGSHQVVRPSARQLREALSDRMRVETERQNMTSKEILYGLVMRIPELYRLSQFGHTPST